MVASAGYSGAVILPSTPSVALTDDVLNNPSSDNATFVESVSAHRYWDTGTVPVIYAELDEVQSVVLTGSPTGGTFTLTFGGQTATLNWNETASAAQTALQALSSIGAGNALCTGGPLPATPIQVEFAGTLGFAAQALFTYSNAGLTGGTSPNVAVTESQHGQAYGVISATTYGVHYASGSVVFSPALLGTSIGVKAHSAYYFPWAVLANVTAWNFEGQTNFEENTSILGDGLGGLQSGAGYKTFQPLLLEGSFSVTKFWVPESQIGFAADITNGTQFIVSGVMLSGNRYEGYCYAKKASIKSDVQKLTDESLDFQFRGPFYLV